MDFKSFDLTIAETYKLIAEYIHKMGGLDLEKYDIDLFSAAYPDLACEIRKAGEESMEKEISLSESLDNAIDDYRNLKGKVPLVVYIGSHVKDKIKSEQSQLFGLDRRLNDVAIKSGKAILSYNGIKLWESQALKPLGFIISDYSGDRSDDVIDFCMVKEEPSISKMTEVKGDILEDNQLGRTPCPEYDPVNHPDYYNQGIEAIDYINSHNLNFNRGSIVKYVTRAGLKDPTKEIQDLEKAVFYLNSEIERVRESNES